MDCVGLLDGVGYPPPSPTECEQRARAGGKNGKVNGGRPQGGKEGPRKRELHVNGRNEEKPRGKVERNMKANRGGKKEKQAINGKGRGNEGGP